MAVLYSTLLPQGLVLCLALLFSTCTANYNGSCPVLTEILDSPVPVFQVDYDTYTSNKTYKVSLPVNDSISFVILKALDKNNHSVGNWQNADKLCKDSALYQVNTQNNVSFWAFWDSPMYTNITTVKLQVFTVNINGTATVSTVELREATTVSPKTSTTRSPNTQHPVTTSTRVRGTVSTSKTSTTRSSSTQHHHTVLSTTLTTTTSSASRAFLSPITDAFQILLIFLTSKLVF